MVVENKPGASTIIGASYVAKSKPDGHTLLVTSAPHTNNPSLMSNLPFDTVNDFSPICLLAKSPFVLIVKNDSPIQNINDFVELAKKKTLTYGSSGNGTNDHLSTEMVSSIYQITLTHTPYKGTGQALLDLLGGHIDIMMCNIVGAVSALKSGKVRGIVVTTAARSSIFPALPTVQEVTGKPFDVSAWTGILAPAGTSKAVIERLNQDIRLSLKDGKVQEAMQSAGAELMGGSAEDFGLFIKDEIRKAQAIIKEKNIKI
ncbi:Tripartite tricarboxylate transporter family receptor [compost metagenome]